MSIEDLVADALIDAIAASIKEPQHFGRPQRCLGCGEPGLFPGDACPTCSQVKIECLYCGEPFAKAGRSRHCYACRTVDPVDGMRVCIRCNGRLPTSRFYKDTSRCRRCVAEIARRELQRPGSARWAAAKRTNRRRTAQLKGATRIETYADYDIYLRDKGLCGICGGFIRWGVSWPNPQSFSIDHIFPMSLWADNPERAIEAPDNVQSAHLLCNIIKRDKVDVS